MIKYLYKRNIWMLIACLSLVSCKKWLDIKPEDRITETAAFASESGMSDALTGIYTQMTAKTLYGQNLTLSVLDCFAQNYWATNTTSKWYQYTALNVTDVGVASTLQGIWENAYVAIANLNNFLANARKAPASFNADHVSLMKGEAFGLRAYLYLDLLRMWGPVYGTADSLKSAIPVYTKVGVDISEYVPANQVMNQIMQDLDSAVYYLATDPVTITGYTSYNNFRFNLVAAKALRARALLYRGDKAAAYTQAKEVIGFSNKFPWVLRSAITATPDKPDRLFSTEVLFGLYTKSIYSTATGLFSENLGNTGILAAGPDNFLNQVYESNLEDYRFSYQWVQSNGAVTYKVLVKYADLVDKTAKWYYMVPLMRMSEMYYIAAETATDPVEGLGYLNTVIAARGITKTITNPALLAAEITKEYRKEFYGEGQLWYYYKRKMMTDLPSPNGSGMITKIAIGKYVFPYPDSEVANR
ncbi:RagB/SusD family nutrient uptake outer membrane protein [Chitinophaga sp. Cy-1792]|uniref:RagB/SusD family nutrient uptake outer membrane protein n=1 Tax=Chitinophaga sp. Cy-1792 TaxID=2608339 RepID=UPI001423974E|nr:RagB/SusD family nutrient uptake outer membrane protein [Chitinophaga sp. Cy-1792]